MKGRLVWALVLLALCGVVLIINRGAISVQLPFYEWQTLKSAAFLAFIAVGVVIGLLLSK